MVFRILGARVSGLQTLNPINPLQNSKGIWRPNLANDFIKLWLRVLALRGGFQALRFKAHELRVSEN